MMTDLFCHFLQSSHPHATLLFNMIYEPLRNMLIHQSVRSCACGQWAVPTSWTKWRPLRHFHNFQAQKCYFCQSLTTLFKLSTLHVCWIDVQCSFGCEIAAFAPLPQYPGVHTIPCHIIPLPYHAPWSPYQASLAGNKDTSPAIAPTHTPTHNLQHKIFMLSPTYVAILLIQSFIWHQLKDI